MRRLAILSLAMMSLSLFGAKKETFFAYRSFWPESAAMRAFGEAGTHSILLANHIVNFHHSGFGTKHTFGML